MDSTLTRIDDEQARRVRETITHHWVKPAPSVPMAAPGSAEAERVARNALDVMLTRQYRVGPLPGPDILEQLLQRVRHFVALGQPIKVMIGYGPLKNPNAVPYSRADWAEFFALGHLVSWHNKVGKVYPPGLRIQIVFDDATLVLANRADPALMRSYMTSVAGLVRALGYDHVFLPPIPQSKYAWILHLGVFAVARWRVWRWERDPANRDLIERMDQAAARNVYLPPGLTLAQQDRFIRGASHRYRVYWEALQLTGVTRSKKRLTAMYLDGAQHHRRQAVALHLTTLDKGQVTQPWQGEGALLDNGKGLWEPCVLTAARRQRYQMTLLNGLELIPYTGFGSIRLARDPRASVSSHLVSSGSEPTVAGVA